MQIIPGKKYTFKLASQQFSILWYWKEDSDDEQFTLSLFDKNMRHGAVGNVERLIEQLPVTDSYETTEAILLEGIKNAKAKGWIIKDAPHSFEL
jgi:hypothetical protein